MSADNFQLPEGWLNTAIQVYTKTPVPAKDSMGNMTITFPSFIGTLKADLDGSMLLLTENGQEILYPKVNVQQIIKASDLAIAPGSTLDMLMGRKPGGGRP